MLRLVLVHSALWGAVAKTGLVFAFYHGRLYTRMDFQNEHNGFETIYGLIQLENKYGAQIPDLYSEINGGLTSDGAGGDFSFWRQPGTNGSLLWPDSDTFGRLDLHIAPLHFIMKQFEAEPMDFKHRADIVFWSGNQGGGDEHARDHFRECADKQPHLFHADTIHWDASWSVGEHILKPHVWDLRKLMRNKFNMYIRGNTWSQSFKRVAQSGGVVFIPEPNPHESFYSRIASKCVDCYLTYDVNNMCHSIIGTLENTSKSEMHMLAEKFQEFTHREFSNSRMLEYMLEGLLEHVSKERFPGAQAGPGATEITVDGVVLTRTDCAMNKREHVLYHNNRHDQQDSGGHKWQLNEWFDDQCNFRETNYLSYVAI